MTDEPNETQLTASEKLCRLVGYLPKKYPIRGKPEVEIHDDGWVTLRVVKNGAVVFHASIPRETYEEYALLAEKESSG
jgi:hypothetical protein